MKTRGSSMVAVMAAMVIILVLVLAYMFGGFGSSNTAAGKDALPERADQKGITIPGAAIYKAKDDVCRSNLQQIRLAIQMAQTSSPEGQAPGSLNDLRLGADFLKCPIDPHEPYSYDPATGKVFCPHPGHLKF